MAVLSLNCRVFFTTFIACDQIRPNTVRLSEICTNSVRAEFVEALTLNHRPFDKLRANGTNRTVLRPAPTPRCVKCVCRLMLKCAASHRPSTQRSRIVKVPDRRSGVLNKNRCKHDCHTQRRRVIERLYAASNQMQFITTTPRGIS